MQSLDFIKPNIIQKLAYKFKYISQINGGLIMLFGYLRIRFFRLISSLESNIEIINTRKRNTINKVQCSKC